jgi:hypothetical protein
MAISSRPNAPPRADEWLLVSRGLPLRSNQKWPRRLVLSKSSRPSWIRNRSGHSAIALADNAAFGPVPNLRHLATVAYRYFGRRILSSAVALCELQSLPANFIRQAAILFRAVRRGRLYRPELREYSRLAREAAVREIDPLLKRSLAGQALDLALRAEHIESTIANGLARPPLRRSRPR